MKIQFAERSKDCKQPIIRVIDALSKSDPDFHAFGEGNPAIEALPQEAIRDIATDIVTNHAEDILLYTNNGGDQEFKDVIMKRLREVKGINTDGNDMLIITGGQQGLYLLPTFSNPTGITTSLEKRKAIYELACKYDKLIVEDDPYSDLRYEGEDVPTIKSMDTEHRVIYLGTFSKTIAAGLRVGFILAEPEIIRIATNNKAAIDSNTPCLNQLICRNFMRDYDFEENIRNIIRINKVKWKAARDSFNKYLPEGWKVYDAKGGLFCYVRSPEGVDEEAFQQCCYRHKVAFSPSSSFSADGLPHGGYRMAFTPNTVEQIIEGCRRFGEAAKEFT